MKNTSVDEREVWRQNTNQIVNATFPTRFRGKEDKWANLFVHDKNEKVSIIVYFKQVECHINITKNTTLAVKSLIQKISNTPLFCAEVTSVTKKRELLKSVVAAIYNWIEFVNLLFQLPVIKSIKIENFPEK